MLIDWFTVAAQAVNFLVLIWLLNRFLYKPVLKAVDNREKKIRSQLEEAQKQKEIAEQEKTEFEKKNKSFEAERKSLLDEASEEAGKLRQQLEKDARHEVAALRERLETSLREERDTLGREIRTRTQQEVIAITRKVLADLASDDLENRMVTVFLQRLKQLDEAQTAELKEAMQSSKGEVLLRSAFELSGARQEEIQNALKELEAEDLDCRFEVAPDKVVGIELTAAGHKMAWSATEYLNSLEKKLTELLDEEKSSAS